MEKQYQKCAETPCCLIHSDMYEEMNKEILKKISFNGTPKKITNDYWNTYLAEFNRLIKKGEGELHKYL